MVTYSACIAEIIAGPPQRGLVHSVFKAAANIVFPGFPSDFVLSLNAATSPRMPNGIQLANPAGTMPFSQLRVGMPVLLGVQRLCIQPLNYVLDLSHAPQWHPYIERPITLDMGVVQKNCAWVEYYVLEAHGRPQGPYLSTREHVHFGGEAHGRPQWGPCGRPSSDVVEMARSLCGRGMGLTPTGDDMLAGWMAIGWLLNGPEPEFLANCQHIVAIARLQTHLLSQCWLDYAAHGYVAKPIGDLLHALTQDDEKQLAQCTRAVLAMGATSGYDVIQGMLMALRTNCEVFHRKAAL